MSRSTCRTCHAPLFKEPLIRFENMPGMAQHFPDETTPLDENKGQDLRVCQCQRCGLVQLDSEPVPYYRDVIRAAAYSPEMGAFRREEFQKFVQDHHLAGQKILEIGCGAGEYLELMAEQGVQTYGIEGGAENVQHCRTKGLNVTQDYLEKPDQILRDGPFDAFFILNFLEHVPDPNSLLQAIACNLTQSGIGLVEVPNFDMILKEKLFSEFISDHLFYFTTQSLTNLLEMNGFEVLSCQSVWHDYSLSALVRKRSPQNVCALHTHQQKIKTDVADFIKEMQGQRVAIWGAGHQALALISLLELSAHIAYVVDSAPFKQGKFTPASHLPIKAPETLKEDPVDAVIVMAASYTDEVARILKADYPSTLKIVLMRDYGLERVNG